VAEPAVELGWVAVELAEELPALARQGVPEMHVEEALWTVAGLLSGEW